MSMKCRRHNRNKIIIFFRIYMGSLRLPYDPNPFSMEEPSGGSFRRTPAGGRLRGGRSVVLRWVVKRFPFSTHIQLQTIRSVYEPAAKLQQSCSKAAAKLRRSCSEVEANLQRRFNKASAKVKENYSEGLGKLFGSCVKSSSILNQKIFRIYIKIYRIFI